MACVALYDMQTIQLKLLMHLVKKRIKTVRVITDILISELLAYSYNIPGFTGYQEFLTVF